MKVFVSATCGFFGSLKHIQSQIYAFPTVLFSLDGYNKDHLFSSGGKQQLLNFYLEIILA